MGCGGEGAAKADPGLSLMAIQGVGPAWASSSINTPAYRQQPVLATDDGGSVVGFYDDQGVACLSSLGPDGTPRARVRMLPRLQESLLGDGHCTISLGMDAGGSVHAVFGAHGNLPLVARVAPVLLQAGAGESDVVATPGLEPITYPALIRVGEELQLWFRADPQSEIRRCRFELSSGVWGPDEVMLQPGPGETVYMNQLAVDGTRLALSWMLRLPSTDGSVRNQGLWLLVSADGGASWRDRSGQAQALPASRPAGALVVDLPPERQSLNQTASCFGPDGTLYLTLYARDEAGRHQVWLATLAPGAAALVVEPVSDNATSFDLAGGGTLVLPLSRPQVVASVDAVHVVYRLRGQVVLASRAVAPGSAWQRRPFDFGDLGVWEPSLGGDHWRRWQRLVVYLQSTRQGPRDTASPGPPTPALLAVFGRG